MNPDTATPGGEGTEQFDDRLDDVFEALSHAYRRFVLVYLARESRQATVRSIAGSLAARDDQVSVDRAAVSLQHAHLPKLRAAGFVDYERGGTVRLREAAGRPLDILDAARASRA